MKKEYKQIYSGMTSRMKHSFIRDILKVTKGIPGMISFAGGLPDPASFPKELLSRLFSEVISEEGDDVLQYGATEGDHLLKKELKYYEKVPYISNDELMINVGSTNGIYCYTRAFIEPGDVVICEAPGFPGSIVAMEACGARIIGVGMDQYGMKPEKLEEVLTSLLLKSIPVKFLYLIPEFQNPTGHTMNYERRLKILEIAIRNDIPILEDQPYRDLRYSGKRIPTLWELARTYYKDEELVTIVKSFSKILGPGLRLGFTAGPPQVIEPMVKWAQKSTVSPDCLSQRVVARFISKGYMDSQISRIIDLYRPKRDMMLAALEKYMPEGINWSQPEGGMFIWVTFPESVDTNNLFDYALEHKIAFIPGSQFYPSDKKVNNEIRLNFSYPEIDQIEEGIRRLSVLSAC